MKYVLSETSLLYRSSIQTMRVSRQLGARCVDRNQTERDRDSYQDNYTNS